MYILRDGDGPHVPSLCYFTLPQQRPQVPKPLQGTECKRWGWHPTSMLKGFLSGVMTIPHHMGWITLWL